jgi:hypothetical protein
MQYENPDDGSYAKDVCRNYPPAVKKIHHDFSERVLFISNKFVNSRKFEEGWIYSTSKGYKINVSDDVSDTYLWLVRHLIKKCCKFTGGNNATLTTYLMAIINSSYTFNDWLKYKYGGSSYIPKVIKNLPKEYSEIFLYLKRGLSQNQITIKIGASTNIEYKINRIRSVLIESGQLYLVERFNVFLGVDKDITEIAKETQVDKQESSNKDVEKIIESILSNLEMYERRLLLMYWGTEMSTRQILLFLKSEDNITDFSKLHINNDKDIYKNITKIIKHLFSSLSIGYPSFIKKYDINEIKLKKVIKIYIKEIYKKNTDNFPLNNSKRIGD